jgi:ankyrin repeat protein
MRGMKQGEGDLSLSRSCRTPTLMKSNSTRLLTRRGRPRLSFEHLAKQGKFDGISRQLEDEQMDDCHLMSWLCESCVGGETPLHTLVRHRPPVRLVHLLAEKLASPNKGSGSSMKNTMTDSPIDCRAVESLGLTMDFAAEMNLPSSESSNKKDVFIPEESRDDQGRTPLHIAAESGCHVKVINRLLKGETCVMPAIAKDEYGRFPLHWACANPAGEEASRMIFSSRSSRSLLPFSLGLSSRKITTTPSSSATATPEAIDNMARVISTLVQIYPEAVCLPDKDGFTPLDLAKQSKADDSIMGILFEAVELRKKVAGERHFTTETDGLALGMLLEISCMSSQDLADDVSSLGWDVIAGLG